MEISIQPDKTFVIVVDLQGDFTTCHDGSLAVQGTDQSYIDGVLTATKRLNEKGYKIIATQDYHPPNHISFNTNHSGKQTYDTIDIDGRTQILWPPHCIQNSKNAEVLIPDDLVSEIIPKGCDPKFDSYSGFFDDGGATTGLIDILRKNKINTLIIYGLATDYCVKATAMDAVNQGFNVILIEDLCKGVAPDTTKTAIEEMKAADIQMLKISEIF